MEEFVFAGNRRRWKYLRPVIGAAVIGVGLWLAALCWTLMKSPALPDIGLGSAPPTVLARRVSMPPARRARLRSEWTVR